MNYEKFTNKYSYFFAFILGMVLMVVIYVFFEATTSSEYRVRTGGDDAATSLTLTSNMPTANTTDEIQAPTPFLGVEVLNVNDIMAEQLELDSACGVIVNLVVPNSPADASGLQRGDVILSLNNTAVKDIDIFKNALLKLNPGDRLRIAFMRTGTKDSTYAELTSSDLEIDSSSKTSPLLNSVWGIVLSPLTDVLKYTFNIPSDINGVIVLSVEPDSFADESGLVSGDVITSIDKSSIYDMTDFFDAIQSDQNSTALLDVYSQGAMHYVSIDSSSIQADVPLQTQTTLRDKIFSFFSFAGGAPFAEDEEDEEGPKGGKLAQDDNITLTSDNAAFNRPSDPPGEDNATGTSSTGDIALNRPSTIPGQTTTGSNNDIVFFIALLMLIILYLSYREYHRK